MDYGPLPVTYENDEDLRQLLYTEITDEKLLSFFFKKGGEVNVTNLQYLLATYGPKQIAQNIVNLETEGLIKPFSSNSYKVTGKAKWRRVWSHPMWTFWGTIAAILALIVAVIAIIMTLKQKR